MAVIPLALMIAVAVAAEVPAATATNPAVVPCENAPARVDFMPETLGAPATACVSAGTATILKLSAPITRDNVALQGGEYFDVRVSGDLVIIMPYENLPLGQTFQLTLRFPDGAAPALGVIHLVANTVAAHQLEVVRHVRAIESYQHEAREARAGAARLRELLQEKEATCETKSGLAGLIIAQILDRDGLSVGATVYPPRGEHDALAIQRFRIPGKRVAIDVTLDGPSYVGFEPNKVSLVDNLGKSPELLSSWMAVVTPESGKWRVVAEWAVDANQDLRTFTLFLTGKNSRTLRFDGVRFP